MAFFARRNCRCAADAGVASGSTNPGPDNVRRGIIGERIASGTGIFGEIRIEGLAVRTAVALTIASSISCSICE